MRIRRWVTILGTLCLMWSMTVARAAEPMTMMGLDELTGRDWAQNEFFTRMEEKTGVGFTYQQFSVYDAYQKEKEKILGGDALPDVLFKADLSTQEELRYAQDGTLIDLAPLLAEHAPNLSKLLDEHPAWREAITLPDGKIVALPAINTMQNQVAVWVNKVWLDALGIAMPQTPEAYRDALIAIRDQDPNKNMKQDEVPLMLIGPWEAKWMMSFFGLAANDYNVYVDESGAVRYAPLEPGFVRYLEYMRNLYDEGLLGAEPFRTVHTIAEQTEKEIDPLRVGGLISTLPTTMLDPKYTTGFVALPPMASEGKTVYRDLLGPVWRGTFAITRACPDPAAALRWVDMLYTEEGAILAYAGVRDADYAYDEEGTWSFLVDQMRSIDNLQIYTLISSGGELPGIAPRNFWEQLKSDLGHVLTQYDVISSVATMPAPLCWPTAEEQAEMDAVQLELGRLVDVGIAKFITGEVPLDAEQIAAFEQSLQDAGAQRMTALWQAAVDRLP